MKTNFESIAIVGTGKLAKHFFHYFSECGLNCTLISTDNFLKINNINSSFRKLQDPEKQNLQILFAESILHSSNTNSAIFLALQDSALQFYIDFLHSKDRNVFHFSGSFYSEKATGIHPLMPFADKLFTLEQYQKIHFSIDNSQFDLKHTFPELKNSCSYISPEEKSMYHALCVISANFPILLWNKCLPILQQMGINKQAFQFYLESNLNNFANSKNPLTGPIARSDFSTITKNIKSLNDQKDLQSVYQNFVHNFCSEYKNENS